MSKSKQTEQRPASLLPHELTLWVVRPLARRLILHHRIGIEQGRQLEAQIQELKTATDMMARELGRQGRQLDAVGRAGGRGPSSGSVALGESAQP